MGPPLQEDLPQYAPSPLLEALPQYAPPPFTLQLDDRAVTVSRWGRRESRRLLDLAEEHGGRWAEICTHMAGRTASQCYERYRSMCHREPYVRPPCRVVKWAAPAAAAPPPDRTHHRAAFVAKLDAERRRLDRAARARAAATRRARRARMREQLDGAARAGAATRLWSNAKRGEYGEAQRRVAACASPAAFAASVGDDDAAGPPKRKNRRHSSTAERTLASTAADFASAEALLRWVAHRQPIPDAAIHAVAAFAPTLRDLLGVSVAQFGRLDVSKAAQAVARAAASDWLDEGVADDEEASS